MYGEWLIIYSRGTRRRPVVKRVLANTMEEAARKFYAVRTGAIIKNVSTDNALQYLLDNDFSDPVLAEAIPEP